MHDDWDQMLSRARAGEEVAWAVLIGSIAGPVLGFFRLRGARDAEDLAAEVFLKIATSLDSFAGDERGFRAWTFTIARRVAIDAHRRSTRQVDTESAGQFADADARPERRASDAIPARSAEDEFVQDFADQQLLAVLDELTVDQRDVVILRVVGGFSINETADILAKEPNAVKQLQHRGLATLRRLVEAGGFRT